MSVIEAVFRVETPALAGTHEPGRSAAIRVPAVLGAMRRTFWLLAPISGKFHREGRFQQDEARKCIEMLLGAAAIEDDEEPASRDRQKSDEMPPGQGAFLFSMPDGELRGEAGELDDETVKLARGMLDQRKISHGSKKNYLFVCPGKMVRLRIRQRRNAGNPERLREDMIWLLRAYGLLGGVGAATRRGFGSLSLERLQSLSPEEVTYTLHDDNYADYIRSLISLVKIDIPPDSIREIPRISSFWKAHVAISGIFLKVYSEESSPLSEVSEKLEEISLDCSIPWEPVTRKKGPVKCSPENILSSQDEVGDNIDCPKPAREPSPVLMHFAKHKDGTTTLVASIVNVGRFDQNIDLDARVFAFLKEVQLQQIWPPKKMGGA